MDKYLEIMEKVIKIKSDYIWEGHAINTLLYIIGTKDADLMNHSYRVAKLAILIAHELQMPQKAVHQIRLAALMHDVGKFCIDSKLLYKTGSLAKVDIDIIRMHATYGYMLLKRLHVSWPLADIVYQHHERQDGSGYPRGLTGDSIRPEARIIAVADFMESITYVQPNRLTFELDNALDINNNFAKKFDRDALTDCARIFAKKDFAVGEIWE
ncbi:HD-GYP domain-containing protein [Sporomusa aerivorans]|uniref:HD-GYP domain-containing protein n=1 Tax=Sporomusa aerivorans TaxID=204936 RepID=UPI00352B2830